MGQILYAQATGNASEIAWNTAANGSGDSAPWGDHLEDDTLETNTQAVTIDVASFTRAQIQNTLGGSFACNLGAVGAREFMCDLLAGTATLMIPTGAAYPMRINGHCTGSSTTSNSRALLLNTLCDVTIDGDVNGGTSAGTYGVYMVQSSATASLRVLGTCRGGSNTTAPGLYLETNSPSIVNHCVGGTNPYATGVFRYTLAGRTCPVTVRGNLDYTGVAAPVTGGCEWDPAPGSRIITPTKRFYPSAASGILGVGV